jgi:hypothetical protein
MVVVYTRWDERRRDSYDTGLLGAQKNSFFFFSFYGRMDGEVIESHRRIAATEEVDVLYRWEGGG